MHCRKNKKGSIYQSSEVISCLVVADYIQREARRVPKPIHASLIMRVRPSLESCHDESHTINSTVSFGVYRFIGGEIVPTTHFTADTPTWKLGFNGYLGRRSGSALQIVPTREERRHQKIGESKTTIPPLSLSPSSLHTTASSGLELRIQSLDEHFLNRK